MRSKADTSYSTGRHLTALSLEDVTTQNPTELAPSVDTAHPPLSGAASSSRTAPPSSFRNNAKTYDARDKRACMNRSKASCQEFFSIFSPSILTEIETFISDLFNRKEMLDTGVTARTFFERMPIFKQIARNNLCEACALEGLEMIMDEPGGWYKRIKQKEEDERLWLQIASKVPLRDGDSVTSLQIHDARRSNPDSVSEQVARTRGHRQDDGDSRIDWARQSASLTALPVYQLPEASGEPGNLGAVGGQPRRKRFLNCC